MEREGRPFEEILAEAQQKGYAEAEPSLDVDGIDTAHKVCVLGTIAFGRHVPMSRLPTSGIRHVSPVDIQHARELGYAIKLLGVLKRTEHGMEARVQAALVPREHLLANIHGVFNGVVVTGDRVGDTSITDAAPGATRPPALWWPTSSTSPATSSANASAACRPCRAGLGGGPLGHAHRGHRRPVLRARAPARPDRHPRQSSPGCSAATTSASTP